MSITPLKKLTVIGPIDAKTATLRELQAFGCLHLIPLTPPVAEPEAAADRDAKDAFKALRFLTDVPHPRRQVRRDPDFDVDAFVVDVLALKQKIRDTSDRRDFLAARIAAVEPWGNLVFPPRDKLAGQRFWFYQLPIKERHALDGLALPWEIVNSDSRFLYVVALSPEEPATDLLPVERTHTGALPLTELRARLEEAEIELESLQADRLAQTRYLTLLRHDMSKAATQAELDFAQEQTRDDEALFVLQGWVPEERAAALTAYTDQAGLAVMIEDPAWTETPPTLLEQPDRRAASVDLAMFYQTPSYRDWDPSVILALSFSIFFAMIVADAGYGALMLVGLLLFHKRLGATPHLRSWRGLGIIVSVMTVIYGILVGSYFGAGPPADSLLARFKVLDLNDFDTMMALSVVVGVAHLVIANLASAWARRRRRSSLASVGWSAAMSGALILWLSGQTGLAAQIGIALMGAGVVAILFFSSDRPITRRTDWLWRLLGGVQGLAGAMSAFGDVLSYMRLFALGLASASLALTFNHLAVGMVDAMPGLGVLAALMLLLVGHALNFALAVMSGVIHGLRLNFIEFYRWGLTEEGTAFRPFARKEI